MSHLVWLEGKHTTQNAHCALVTSEQASKPTLGQHWEGSPLQSCWAQRYNIRFNITLLFTLAKGWFHLQVLNKAWLLNVFNLGSLAWLSASLNSHLGLMEFTWMICYVVFTLPTPYINKLSNLSPFSRYLVTKQLLLTLLYWATEGLDLFFF